MAEKDDDGGVPPAPPAQVNRASDEAPATFSVRSFLAERGALVVHFSTPMRRDDALRFPDDLLRAQALSEKGLCCSTILPTDVGPGEPNIDYAEANAVGCIGIILDVDDAGSVCAVHPSDCGTYRDADGNLEYDGDEPTAEFCARSIDRRSGNNEWVVKNFRTIGLFLFRPTFVHIAPPGSPERPIAVQGAIAPFPGLRVFSVENQQFVEFDRTTNEWRPVEYGAIVGNE
ncbi:hypothetical protein WN73_37770 [Bradyrhizobium sp. CCBAU 45394]|uniref:hypothetical protein n=1 Tax=Bradyrhizobium sp. CCBAU 45394 TaxID=1325087 RepID=UPI0023026D5B|nr:hypothetical protein [Bradyrhizobium sp. CCBAU 45394]MDA9396267.1 hypothetical protein [Bradyrhizobium sp. CCBAU 45394]